MELLGGQALLTCVGGTPWCQPARVRVACGMKASVIPSPPLTPHSPSPPNRVAAEQWWSSQFLLPCASQPLSKEHQIAVTHTLAAWGDAVESLPADAAGTTAEHQKAAWAELIASGKLAPEQLEVAQRAWRWRELLQRAMDGCDSTAVQRWVGA